MVVTKDSKTQKHILRTAEAAAGTSGSERIRIPDIMNKTQQFIIF